MHTHVCVLSLHKCDRGAVMLGQELIPVSVVYSCFSAVFRRSVWLRVLSSCSGIEV